MTRAPRLAPLLAAILLLPGCGGGGSGSPGELSPDGAQQSLNWAGYVLSGAPASFTQAVGSWIVPGVACGGTDTGSSTWAGIGGGTTEDPTLVQAGTTQACSGGHASYGAWWEVIPAPAVDAGAIDGQDYPVGPGDEMRVTVDGSSGAVWEITIENHSRNWTFNTSVAYSSAGATAEWIEEAPLSAGTSGAGQVVLANFGQASFFSPVANGAPAQLTQDNRVVMVDGDGHVVANTSGADSGGAFRVCYGGGPC